MKNYHVILILMGLASGLFYGCSKTVAGTDDVQDTGVVAGVIQSDGDNPVAGAIVTLYPEGWNPRSPNTSEIKTGLTNEEGAFEISDVQPGRYNMLAENFSETLKALVQGIEVDSGETLEIEKGSFELRQPGEIKIPPEYLKTSEDGYVYIPGTDIHARADDQFLSVLDGIPVGSFTEIIFVAKEETMPVNLTQGPVEITESTSAILSSQSLHPWYQGAVMNFSELTRLPEASTFLPLSDFPVLLRRDALFIDNMGGQGVLDNIIVTNARGAVLPLEISYLDIAGQSVEFWSSLDSLTLDLDYNSLLLFSGEGGQAVPFAPVFTAQAGFTGVYHFSGTDFHSDASDNSNNLLMSGEWNGYVPESSLIGTGMVFTGDTQTVFVDREFDDPGQFTLTLWTKTNTGTGGKLIGFTDYKADSLHANFDRHIWMDDTGYVHYGVYHDWVLNGDNSMSAAVSLKSPVPLNDGQWHFLAATLSESGMVLYVDGQEVARDASATNPAQFTGRWRIGSGIVNDSWLPEPGNDFYTGSIDEVQIMHVARPAAWIKLMYDNQKENSALWGGSP